MFVTAVLARLISQLRNGGSAHFAGLSAKDRKWPHASEARVPEALQRSAEPGAATASMFRIFPIVLED